MIEFEIIVAMTLFGIGLFGVTTQKSFLKIFFSLEILLNSVILLLASTGKYYGIEENFSLAYLLIALATLEASAGVIIFLGANRVSGKTEIGGENV
jgi:NADH:ubiquinone oxidoreductase subunit K